MSKMGTERRHLDDARSESIEWVLGERERFGAFAGRTTRIVPRVQGVSAFQVRAAGSYRGYVIEQRRTCALVRHLALRDRATTRDGVLRFLARTGERRSLFRRRHLVPARRLLPPARQWNYIFAFECGN